MIQSNSAAKQPYLPPLIALILLISLPLIEMLPSGKWIHDIADNYLWIHTSLEFMGILVSFSIFTVGWATYRNVQSTDIIVLSVTSLMMGVFDMGHTLSFTGMPDFITPSNPDKAIYFWLASRLAGSLGFLYVSVSPPSEVHLTRTRYGLLAAAIAIIVTCFYFVLFSNRALPVMFVPGVGLTALKVAIEGSTIGISIVAGLMYLRRGRMKNLIGMNWIGCASLIFAMAGVFFTLYREFDDLNNFAGHVYKAIASFMVYRAVFVECVSMPYQEARRSAREASEASASKTRFLANVSHELRTPLGVISGFSELLTASKDLAPEPREWAATIGRNSRQLRGLIDDLLDLSKAENEKMSVEWSEFSVIDVVEEVAGGLNLQAQAKNVSIRIKNLLPAGRKTKSDEVRFRQILTNIAGNAVKFTTVGRVEIEIREKVESEIRSDSGNSTFVEVAVKDSGIGILKSDVERLFQPFSQASDPSLRRFGGTGLGLALSKKLSVLLGGDLILKQSSERGSEFVFWIRDQDVTLIPKVEAIATRAENPDFSRLKILAVEDSIDNRSLLALYLKPTKASVTFAENGEQAFTLASRESFDLVLMDIQMPIMDGFEAVSRLRSSGTTTPILALTAHAHAPERERAMRGGFDGYLVKPLSRSELWSTIQKMNL